MDPNTAASSTGVSWISASRRTSLHSALGWAEAFTLHLLPLVPPVVASGLSVFKHSSGSVATRLCVIGCLTDEPQAPAGCSEPHFCDCSAEVIPRPGPAQQHRTSSHAYALRTDDKSNGAHFLLVSLRYDGGALEGMRSELLLLTGG